MVGIIELLQNALNRPGLGLHVRHDELLGDHVEHHDVGPPGQADRQRECRGRQAGIVQAAVSRAVIVCRPLASEDVVTDQVPSAATVAVPIAVVPS